MKEGNPFLQVVDGHVEITEAGHDALRRMVTDSHGQVYAFTNGIPAVIVAAAMARLSRRAGDLRATILDEFIVSEGSAAEHLIERVVAEYGDDSVQQLVGIHMVVEGASNLLTKLLEHGRLAAYLEQSTRYIIFYQQDKDGKFLYYTPELPETVRPTYIRYMDWIFERYSLTVKELIEYLRKKYPSPTDPKERTAWLNATKAQACDAVRPVLPVATKSTVGIFASGQSIESLIMHLASEPLEEARRVGEDILREARKVIPSFLKRADDPTRGRMISSYRFETRSGVRALARKHLDFSRAGSSTGKIRLVNFWPADELNLVPEMLYESAGGLSLEEIQRQVADWPIEKKEEVFRAYMGERKNRRHRPGRALEFAHFEWEIDGRDYGTYRDLQRHRMVDGWEQQRLDISGGYEIPDLIVEADLSVKYKECFDLSRDLFEFMRENGHELEAQYATLLGHRMRYRFMMNAREMFHFLELRTGPAGHPGYRKIGNEIFDIYKRVHPRSADSMIFVNQGDNPDLTRLAAERATQAKLSRLGE